MAKDNPSPSFDKDPQNNHAPHTTSHHNPAVPMKVWIALAIVVLLAVIFWPRPTLTSDSSTATSSGTIDVKGIFYDNNAQLFTVNTRVDGVVKAVNVKAGDKVKTDQIVVQMLDHDYDIRLSRAKLKVENTTRDFEKLKKDVEKEGAAEKQANNREMAAKEYNVAQLDHQIEHLETELATQKKLLDQGLVSPANVSNAEDRLSSAKVERETLESSIANIRFNLTKGYRTDDLKSKESDLFQAIEDRDLLQFQEHYYQVQSPHNGQVLELLVSPGEILHRGSPLMLMEVQSDLPPDYRVYVYLPVEQGASVAVGDSATILVPIINPQKYGTLAGRVTQISPYVISHDSIQKLVLNSDLVSYLAPGNGPVIAVTIEPETDPTTHEFKWSSGKKPVAKILTGTLCSVSITPSQ